MNGHLMFTVGTDEGCLSGHYWHGSSQCSRCDARLRCCCGAYVREDNFERHMETCRVLSRLPDEEEGQSDG